MKSQYASRISAPGDIKIRFMSSCKTRRKSLESRNKRAPRMINFKIESRSVTQNAKLLGGILLPRHSSTQFHYHAWLTRQSHCLLLRRMRDEIVNMFIY